MGFEKGWKLKWPCDSDASRCSEANFGDHVNDVVFVWPSGVDTSAVRICIDMERVWLRFSWIPGRGVGGGMPDRLRVIVASSDHPDDSPSRGDSTLSGLTGYRSLSNARAGDSAGSCTCCACCAWRACCAC